MKMSYFRKKHRKFWIKSVMLSLMIICFIACVASSSHDSSAVPNYDTPERKYIRPDYNVLNSEFLTDYVGKYIIIEGQFVYTGSGKFTVNNRWLPFLSYVVVSTDDKKKPLEIVWPKQNKEDGRVFVGMQRSDKIKVYAYVQSMIL